MQARSSRTTATAAIGRVRATLRALTQRGATLLAALCITCLPPQTASAAVLYRSFSTGSLTVHYQVVLPPGYRPSRTYPAVLAFPGGAQGMEAVEGAIERYFRAQAERRGYIVIVPAAPNGQLFFEGGDRIFPAFLKELLTEYHVERQKFHAAGVSNGGISAFHIAALYPQFFLSITAFPGYLPQDTPAQRRAIAPLCIHMFVGEFDPLGWQSLMQSQAREFAAAGLATQFSLEKGQPHQMQTLEGDHASRLFDVFQQAQQGCAAAPGGREPR